MFGLFCKHEWEVLDKIVIDPPIDNFKDNMADGKVKIPQFMFQTVITTICNCKKCGKIKRFETKLFNKMMYE